MTSQQCSNWALAAHGKKRLGQYTGWAEALYPGRSAPEKIKASHGESPARLFGQVYFRKAYFLPLAGAFALLAAAGLAAGLAAFCGFLSGIFSFPYEKRGSRQLSGLQSQHYRYDYARILSSTVWQLQ
ncbi:MAG: hypothetical protein KDA57_10455 [Planctomycetales bacterium]|nr:hypothetical protein [Planctomycetales bacterium]